MNSRLFGGLRLRLILLVALAVIPAMALIVDSDVQDRQLAVSQAKDQPFETITSKKAILAKVLVFGLFKGL